MTDAPCNLAAESFQMVGVPTFSEFMIGRRTFLGISERKRFARVSGIADTLIWQLETNQGTAFHRRRDETRTNIAAALQVQQGALEAFSRGDQRAIEPYEWVKPEQAEIRDDDGPAAGEIPTWEIEVSASNWSQVAFARLDYDDPQQRAIINAGRFRLIIRGSCMEPEYPSGSTVEFQVIRVEGNGIEINHDYVFCNSEGAATFKRVMSVSDDAYELVALNQPAHPGAFKVPRQEVTRVARVIGRVLPPPPPVPVKLARPKGRETGRSSQKPRQ